MSQKTIAIGQAESAEALVTAVTEALSREFGVEPADDGVVCPFPGSGIGFHFSQSGSNAIKSEIVNAFKQTAAGQSSVSFVQTSIYLIDVFYSTKRKAVAVSLRDSSKAAEPDKVIALNASGECVGMAAAAGSVFSVRENETRTCAVPAVFSTGTPAFSLVRFPDYFGGAVFEEVYLVLSAPASLSAGMVIHAENADFMPVRSSTSALAIPI